MNITEYKSQPCPICGHKGWCGISDEDLILCKRPPSPPEVAGYVYKGMAKDGQTAMYVEEGKERRPAHHKPPAPRRAQRTSTSPDVLREAYEAAVAALTPELRTALAAELGLPESVLAQLEIGWSDTARHHADPDITGAYMFPESDGQGRPLGISYRFPPDRIADRTDADGKPLGNKSGPAGLRRGLTLPAGWKEMPDPVLVVEGPTDVLAARAAGLSVIGRPSNSGGADQIAQLCRHRQVVILGENDRKPDGRWPGKDGAEAVARRLEERLQRPVPTAYPPDGIKDLRDWVRTLVPAWEDADLAAVRQTILEAVRPPALVLMATDRDKRGRVTVKAFRWADGADAAAIHSDRLNIEGATARGRFARAVAKIVPDTDVEELSRRILAVPLPPDGAERVRALVERHAEEAQREDTISPPDQDVPPDPQPAESRGLPVVFVPGGPVPITESAVQFGALLDKTNQYYIRGGMVTAIGQDKDGKPVLETIRPAALSSVLETVAKLKAYRMFQGQPVPVDAICSEQNAKLIQSCAAFQALLPPIHLLSRCPVLIERDGELVQISGYDRDSGILAFGEPAADVELDDAVALLSDMLAEFRFASPADRARALAAIVTPAMVFGDLLGGRAPVDLGEADKSQTGKGYRAKLTAAVYGHIVKTVTQRKGGVGSLEESFATALVQGYNFISLDNVRSAIDSPALESFMTEDSFLARVPHLAAIEVDPRRVIVQLTSNRAEITTDLANRSACVRLLKQPEGYRFRKYPEGGLLEHVRANQPLYLGAVFAVVRAWHAAGKPMTDTTGHDFRAWAGKLDWIVQNVLNAGPLLEGHRETQVRMATPVLNWLRDVALAVRNGGRLGLWLRAHDLVDIVAERSDAELPGLADDADLADEEVKKKVLQAVGRRMAQCFGPDSVRVIDTFRIERKETEDTTYRRTTREYCFELLEPAPEKCAYAPAVPMAHRRTIGADASETAVGTPEPALTAAPESAEPASCAYAAPMGAPMDAPMKPLCAPIAPMGSGIRQREDQKTHLFENTCVKSAQCTGVIGTHRRIGAIGAGTPPPAEAIPELDEVLV